jgi:hypothetical protein
VKQILKKPNAYLPFLMSAAALLLVRGYLAIFGNVNHEDEGVAAHLFQLLMAGQLPIMAFFVIRWLPKSPKQALIVLALQIFAAFIPFALVYFLEL